MQGTEVLKRQLSERIHYIRICHHFKFRRNKQSFWVFVHHVRSHEVQTKHSVTFKNQLSAILDPCSHGICRVRLNAALHPKVNPKENLYSEKVCHSRWNLAVSTSVLYLCGVVHIVCLVKQIHQINVWHVLNDKFDLNCALRARVLTAKKDGHHHGSMGLDSSLSLYAAIAASWRVQQQSAKFKTSTRRELKSSAHETLRCRAMWAMTMLSVHKQRLDNTRSFIDW